MDHRLAEGWEYRLLVERRFSCTQWLRDMNSIPEKLHVGFCVTRQTWETQILWELYSLRYHMLLLRLKLWVVKWNCTSEYLSLFSSFSWSPRTKKKIIISDRNMWIHSQWGEPHLMRLSHSQIKSPYHPAVNNKKCWRKCQYTRLKAFQSPKIFMPCWKRCTTWKGGRRIHWSFSNAPFQCFNDYWTEKNWSVFFFLLFLSCKSKPERLPQ